MMDAERQLFLACEQWRSLSAVEGQAIEAADWSGVEKHQAAKALLQPKILAASEALRRRAAQSAEEAAALERRLQELVGDLVALERRNETALAAHYRTARGEHADLERSRRSLRQVHRAYAGSDKSGWHSYS